MRWLAILAIIMSGVGLLADITQELAWDGRIEQLNALYIGIYASPQPTTATITNENVVASETQVTPVPVVVSEAQAAPVPVVAATGITYEQICGVDESNMTDPQLESHAQRSANQTFNGWQGWVYDVVSRSDGTYDLQIAMEERGLFWSRNIVVESIPTDLATRLNVEQPITFDGRVARVDYMFESMCNPMVVDNFVLR